MTIFDHFDHFGPFLTFSLEFSLQNFSGRFDTSGSMVPHLVPEIEGGYPERDGEGGEEEEEGGEGLVLENSRSWIGCTPWKTAGPGSVLTPAESSTLPCRKSVAFSFV